MEHIKYFLHVDVVPYNIVHIIRRCVMSYSAISHHVILNMKLFRLIPNSIGGIM